MLTSIPRTRAHTQPSLYVKYTDVRTVTFDRPAGATSKNFRMTLSLKNGTEQSFSNIARYDERERLLLPSAYALLLAVVPPHGFAHDVLYGVVHQLSSSVSAIPCHLIALGHDSPPQTLANPPGSRRTHVYTAALTPFLCFPCPPNQTNSEEYTQLLNFLRDKNMRIEEMQQASYGAYMDSDMRGGEKDHYLERVKGEAGSESESEDEDFNPDAASGGSDVDEEYASLLPFLPRFSLRWP